VTLRSTQEEALLAELYANLKGAKKKHHDWIKIAKMCRTLSNHYGSVKTTAEKLGVSYQLVRSIISLLTLPKEAQQLVRENKILYDAAQRILTIRNASKEIQDARRLEVAKAVAGLPSHKQREIIQFARQNPESSVLEYKERTTRPKHPTEKIFVAVVPLRSPMYRSLHDISRAKNMSVEKLILEIVNQWLEEKLK